MVEGVRMNNYANDLLNGGTAEGTLRTRFNDVDVQGRLDYWCDHMNCIVDLKTCNDLRFFENDAKNYGYAYQMSFYQTLVHYCFDEFNGLGKYPDVYMVAIEKIEPYRCGVWKMLPEVLDIARADNFAAIDRLKNSLKTDSWPTGYEELRIFDSI